MGKTTPRTMALGTSQMSSEFLFQDPIYFPKKLKIKKIKTLGINMEMNPLMFKL
jgi:hypothetical protein